MFRIVLALIFTRRKKQNIVENERGMEKRSRKHFMNIFLIFFSDQAEEAARRLKSLRIEAVSLYTKRKYDDAKLKFQEAVDLLTGLNPKHKDIEALRRSIDSCNNKVGTNRGAPSRQVESHDHPLLDKLRQQLAARGARGFAGLQRRFASMDVRMFLIFFLI